METILITGGSGTIGMALSAALVTKNYAVHHLSRSVSENSKYPTFKWDIKEGSIDPKAFENVTYIIHLAGENVGGGRWTKERKNRIRSSRIDSLELLLNNLPDNKKLKALISASGISIYGTLTSEQIFTEEDAFGSDFLAQVSVDWEAAADTFKSAADRIVKIRTGVVLNKDEGALAKIIQPIKLGVGSPLGTGNQYMPWIHLDDIVGVYIKAIEDKNINGAYNAVASEHATNRQLTKTVAKILGKSLWAPKVPSFTLALLFGDMADIILKGSRIDNQKIKDAGYSFKFDSLEDALRDLLD
ncbi:TIGR01777 family oxidoreductase [Crocinitomix sp.]|nr:TIGR01777 family oxidoreductase [Crocinitomix sp.]